MVQGTEVLAIEFFGVGSTLKQLESNFSLPFPYCKVDRKFSVGKFAVEIYSRKERSVELALGNRLL